MKLRLVVCCFIFIRTVICADGSLSNFFDTNTHSSWNEPLASETASFRNEEPVTDIRTVQHIPGTSTQVASEAPDARSKEQYVLANSRNESTENSTAFESKETSVNDTLVSNSTETLDEILSSDENWSTFSKFPFPDGSTKYGRISTSFSTPSSESNETSESSEEEKVIAGTPTVIDTGFASNPSPKTIFEKSLEFIKDTYTLSIIIPIAAGIIFASTIIIFIATCRCIQRQCRRRRFRKKVQLPDSVKNLRPSDRARLLGESDDDEF